jgi:hypothetical protein
MSVTHTVTRSYKDQSANTINLTEILVGNAELNIDDSVAIAANHQIHWACTRANLQAVALYAAGPVTVYTNNPSGGGPQDTIALVAGQTLVWSLATDLLAKCPFAADVTTVYVTNAGSGAVAFKIRALLNQ